MEEFRMSPSTLQIEGLVWRISREAGLSERVTFDVLDWYAKIGICMIDLLGTLYNQQVDDLTQLSIEHDHVIRPLWAALMYFNVPPDQKWLWKDEAMSMIMPFSLFAEAAQRWQSRPEIISIDEMPDDD